MSTQCYLRSSDILAMIEKITAAAGQVDVNAVMVAWIYSPEHLENAMGDYTMCGSVYALNEKGSGLTKVQGTAQNVGQIQGEGEATPTTVTMAETTGMWSKEQVQQVVNSTGAFTTRDKVSARRKSSVVKAAIPSGYTPMFVMVVKDERYKKGMHVVFIRDLDEVSYPRKLDGQKLRDPVH
ncbi:hypothetical protein L916_17866 [Phytophthora nicotianae]|uniref:Uncharacterized protein n=1 Tax=Phytophthora nicotianae TaxID=4792 RepID=W2I3M4_PHYNI|nr:hypothetical protein L916_17866 [Phytophthora nicotianae]